MNNKIKVVKKGNYIRVMRGKNKALVYNIKKRKISYGATKYYPLIKKKLKR